MNSFTEFGNVSKIFVYLRRRPSITTAPIAVTEISRIRSSSFTQITDIEIDFIVTVTFAEEEDGLYDAQEREGGKGGWFLSFNSIILVHTIFLHLCPVFNVVKCLCETFPGQGVGGSPVQVSLLWGQC